jgi:hypothetical protein
MINDPWFLCLLSGFAGIGALVFGVKVADGIMYLLERLGLEVRE